jgi:CRISPR-associated endonuclease/helicase Cas3
MLSDAARALWAKSPKSETDPSEGHSLIAHLLDVAACTWEILEREPTRTLELFATDLQLEISQARAWVCALAGLHDLGKASPAFQQKWDVGRDRVKQFLPWKDNQTPPPKDIPHSAISQVALCTLLPSIGWSIQAAQQVSDAVGAHHGWRIEIELLRKADTRAESGGQPWKEVRRELFEAVLKTLEVADAPQSDSLTAGAFQRLAGLTSFADWIGSSLPFAAFDGNTQTYFEGAKKRARTALDGVGWTKRLPLISERQSFEHVFSFLVEPDQTFRPRALQIQIAGLLEGIDAPTLFVVEAPMGEGKTEAAFYAHLELQRQNGHRGLYVALPTQATGNAMFERTRDFLQTFSATRSDLTERLDLQLLHGATLLKESYQDIVIRKIDEKEDEVVVARSYFSHRKRALLSEYGVGTIDQALLSVLNIKHQFVRLWGLGNRVVVLDEVHAYDTYTGTLIELLVRWLHALGSSVIVMSATLPANKRSALLKAFGAKNIPEEQYPRITRVSNGRAEAVHVPVTAEKKIKLERLSQHDNAVRDKLLELTSDRGCVACIVNTVDRAQRLYTALKNNAQGVPVMLFHARYPVTDRQRRELECLNIFSKDGFRANPNRPKRMILIATQVVEQSLDLDFDAMISDLAPVDLLLQRAGRLHRHEVNAPLRGSHTQATLFVAGLEPDGSQPDLTTNYWHYIYDEYILLRTWRALEGRDQLEFPEEIDALVQIVYGDAPLGDLDEAMKLRLDTTREKLERDEGRDTLDAAKAVIGDPRDASWEDPTRGFRSHPDDEPAGGTKRVSTRKGAESVTVVPIWKVGDHYLLEPNDALPVPLGQKLTLEQAKTIYGHSVRLGRRAVVYGIEAHVKQYFKQTPWQDTPLLQGVMPLVLEDGRAVFGKTSVRLDSNLGVVYER